MENQTSVLIMLNNQYQNGGAKPIELTPEHRVILDDLRRSCAELDMIYGLFWTVYPSRYERIYGKAA